jgi:flavin reductase (DIM6/NTAB) family NADH-FMN oxidoreductase RutF
VPVLDGALAWLACELRALHPGGDHTIGVGEVVAMHHEDGEPLLFYAGAYARLARDGERSDH